MAAAAVSGVLALMQDYFTNTLHTTPSPALLKAMLINGARPTGSYNLQVNNPINLEGWGLVNLPDSIPSGAHQSAQRHQLSMFFVDQSPTNALATGDSRTYNIYLSPGAAGAAVAHHARVDRSARQSRRRHQASQQSGSHRHQHGQPDESRGLLRQRHRAEPGFQHAGKSTNVTANVDAINNVENVFLPANVGTNFTIVVNGTAVNVNAVTAQTNDCGGQLCAEHRAGFRARHFQRQRLQHKWFFRHGKSGDVQSPGDQRITVVTSTNASPLLNQMVGASSPLLGTNTILRGSRPYVTNELVTMGQTNQWHFYVVTNYGTSADFTNAAFVIFLPHTLSIPRGGVFAEFRRQLHAAGSGH